MGLRGLVLFYPFGRLEEPGEKTFGAGAGAGSLGSYFYSGSRLFWDPKKAVRRARFFPIRLVLRILDLYYPVKKIKRGQHQKDEQ